MNLFILAAAVWAMLAWFERRNTLAARRRLALSWFVFSIVAFTKLYPLALFLFPFFGFLFSRSSSRKSATIALLASAAGAVVLLVPPLFLSGVYPAWFDALTRKGLPTDTHNQSLLAFLIRMFSGEPFYPLVLGGEPLRVVGLVWSAPVIQFVWGTFALAALVALVRLSWRSGESTSRKPLVGWIALALCFLPAHLVWKSYFVLGIPLAVAVLAEARRDLAFRKKLLWPSVAGVAVLSFTGVDVVGPHAAAWVEAVSPFLWVTLAIVATGWARLSSGPPSRARIS